MNDPYQVLNVPRSASDEQVKKAYLNLARKYHPDNYHDNPLADLAQEKMKEINAAYEQIQKERSHSQNSAAGASYSGYGGYGGGATQSQSYGANAAFQQVRLSIRRGDLTRAEGLLNAISDHGAEWNFLKGAICSRRGWLDESRRYYETACRLEPGNAEYRQALEFMKSGGQTTYQDGGTFGTDTCGGDSMCSRFCCAWLLCNGCGFGGARFCCI